MSEENVEVVRRLYAALNEVGISGLYGLPDAARRKLYAQSFDPELEVRQSTDLIFDTAETFRGYDGFLEATRELIEAFGDIRFDVGEAFEAGSRVVFEVRVSATGRESGIPVHTQLIAHLWELNGELVRRWVVYPTLDEALEAAGLSQ